MIFSSAPNDWLMHHGIKGQKWGIRRYQNPDGTLTAEGRKRYGLNDIAKPKNIGNLSKRERRKLALKEYNKLVNKQYKADDELYKEYGNNKTAVKEMNKLSNDAFKQGIKAINEIYDVDLNKTFMARRALALASLASIATVAVTGKFMYNRTVNENKLKELNEGIEGRKIAADGYKDTAKHLKEQEKESLDKMKENERASRSLDSRIDFYNENLKLLEKKFRETPAENIKERSKILMDMADRKLDISDLSLESSVRKEWANEAKDNAFDYRQKARQFNNLAKDNENAIKYLQSQYDYLDKHPYRIE